MSNSKNNKRNSVRRKRRNKVLRDKRRRKFAKYLKTLDRCTVQGQQELPIEMLCENPINVGTYEPQIISLLDIGESCPDTVIDSLFNRMYNYIFA
jgi:hypothetical protein